MPGAGPSSPAPAGSPSAVDPPGSGPTAATATAGRPWAAIDTSASLSARSPSWAPDAAGPGRVWPEGDHLRSVLLNARLPPGLVNGVTDEPHTLPVGLEFLVAGDVVRTVALEPTLINVGVLGRLVLIRTFLSWSLA